MQALTITGNTALVSGELNAGLFERWTAFIDASPKTVETYSKNIRRFLAYLQSNGITQPQRDDILSYRDYLKAHYKPTTVQGYLALFPVDRAGRTLPECCTADKGRKAGHRAQARLPND